MADTHAHRDHLQKEISEKIENEDLLKAERNGTSANANHDKDYFFETHNAIEEIGAIPAKPWYFTHV